MIDNGKSSDIVSKKRKSSEKKEKRKTKSAKSEMENQTGSVQIDQEEDLDVATPTDKLTEVAPDSLIFIPMLSSPKPDSGLS